MPQVEFEESLMFSSLVIGEDTCSCFYVSSPCVDVKLGSFQQWKSYIDLKASLFQQREFDTSVSPFSIEDIEELVLGKTWMILASVEVILRSFERIGPNLIFGPFMGFLTFRLILKLCWVEGRE